jgi:hypothetical protein
MKYLILLTAVVLGMTGCATSSDVTKRDERIKQLEAHVAELSERLEKNEAIIRNGDISEILKLIDEMKTEPVVQVELIGEQ